MLCCLQAACKVAHAAGAPVWFEPVSVPKAVRATKVLSCLTYISPNAHELIAMAVALDPGHNTEAAQRLLLQLAAGVVGSAAVQLQLLAPFLLSLLMVSSNAICFCTTLLGIHMFLRTAVHL